MKVLVSRIMLLMQPLISKIIVLVVIGSAFLTFAGIPTKSAIDADNTVKIDWNTFIQAYKVINNYKPASITTKDIFYSGIRGMLNTLDPHTHFLDTNAYRFMQEEQEGSFYGIGISFDISPDGYLRVVAPIDGTPSQKLGIRAGDHIVKIDGISTKNITEIEVIKKLRGKRGTSVIVTIQREGVDKLFDLKIVRDKIPLFTVRDPYIIRPGIGYIKITQFSRPTTNEFLTALEKLKKKGMNKLIIDLRSNPGGLLDQAVNLTNIFVKKGNKIVSTDGRTPNSHIEFMARNQAKFPDIPIIVLVNGASASASEIVSGALQDLDRALIVGTKSYGKGLVQRQYPLPLKTAIQITTAKYYTPSNRCIQKSYETPHEIYFQKHGLNGMSANSDKKTFFSKGGRKVEGGGGIVPDIEVKQKIPEIILQLAVKEVFFEYAIKYSNNNPKPKKTFTISNKVYSDFQNFVQTKKIDVNKKDWIKYSKDMKMWIKQEIISANFGLEQKLKVANEHDHQLQQALKLFDKAEALLKKFHKTT